MDTEILTILSNPFQNSWIDALEKLRITTKLLAQRASILRRWEIKIGSVRLSVCPSVCPSPLTFLNNHWTEFDAFFAHRTYDIWSCFLGIFQKKISTRGPAGVGNAWGGGLRNMTH